MVHSGKSHLRILSTLASTWSQVKASIIVLEDPYKLPFDSDSVDIVICSSCFEHSEMFWLLFLEVMRILKPTGLFYMNAPSNGAFHKISCRLLEILP